MSKTKKLSKALALVIMLALVIGILPMGAMASATSVYVRFYNKSTQIGAVSVTTTENTAYAAIDAAITSLGSSIITSSEVDENGIHSINGISPIDTIDNAYDAWLYTVNDKLAVESIGDMPISSGDVITVFYAENYKTTHFAYIVPDGAATIGNAIAAGSNDTFYYRVATSTVDFNNLYSTISSTSQSTSGVSYVTASPTIGTDTVIPAYKRVIGTESGTLAAWKAETLAAYDDLTSDQQTSLASLYSAANSSSATMSDVNALANAVAPLTRANSAALKRLAFTENNEYLNIVQTSTGKNGFDPNVTEYTLQVVSGSITVTAEALAGNASVSYSSSGSGMSVSSTGAITFSAAGKYTLTVAVSNTIETDNTVSKSYTVHIYYTEAATSDVPSWVCGYLPVGQFARPNSFGWGTIFTDNTNIYGDGNTPKFLSGYVSTGVSLGMLGGYVQFEFTTAIGNDDDNPYGIDFIVYGNAFNGNPEAGSVMVYGKNAATNTYGWYNLAGSRHYSSGTKWDQDISYIKITNDNTTIGNSTFAKKGVYYSLNYEHPESDIAADVNAAISAADWYAIPTSATVSNPVPSASTTSTVGISYWPEIGNNENYEQVWKINGDTHVGGVYWHTSGSAPVITYEGVTMVPDSDSTDYYQWGYADVRQNGSNYGTAINPYASAASAVAGGDGYDLSWAVDTEGKPVSLSDVRYVRVYSAVLFNAGIFGETSTEVNGIYVASGEGTGQTTSVQGASLYVTWENNGSVSNPALASTITSANTFNVDAETEITVTFSSSGNYIFVNEETGTGSASLNLTLEDGEEQIIRVIAKDSTTGLPYIGFMKLVGVRP